MAHIIGHVYILEGEGKAIDQDGVERILTPQSPVHGYDRIVSGIGSNIVIALNDNAGSTLTFGSGSDVLLDEDVFKTEMVLEEYSDATVAVEDLQALMLT